MQISFAFAGSQVQISWQNLTKLVWKKAPGSTTLQSTKKRGWCLKSWLID